jgi:CRISPR/Cas system CSM-associated protein Csm3 (group 7 of RAMP superfamily)
MFERGRERGNGAAKVKCAVRMELLTAQELTVAGGERRIAKGDTDSAWVAQLVERVLGKDEVTGSIPVPGSRILMELG